ncbi:hypothetical protein [Prevotella merdae]|uniref:hypothetical protein n=1 Tax=Prevotella merdae TaxID=2079531 RepID=UPI003567775F
MVVRKFGEWVDKECPLIEDEDDLNGEKAIRVVMDKSLLEESIITSLEKANKERVAKVKKRQGRRIWEVRPATFVDAYLFLINLSCMKREWLQIHVKADKTTFCMDLADGYVLEQTEGWKRMDAEALLRISKDRKYTMKVYFYKKDTA